LGPDLVLFQVHLDHLCFLFDLSCPDIEWNTLFIRIWHKIILGFTVKWLLSGSGSKFTVGSIWCTFLGSTVSQEHFKINKVYNYHNFHDDWFIYLSGFSWSPGRTSRTQVPLITLRSQNWVAFGPLNTVTFVSLNFSVSI